MERLTRPLFRFDPGWLFIAAGLSVCAAGVLLPAQADLQALQIQLDMLRQEETQAYARLRAHSNFMDQVDRADPAIIRRLAATQLNMVPEGDKPVLLASSLSVPVTHWIDATVSVDIRPPKPTPVSRLSNLASGEHRLWMMGGGILAVFVGLVLGPGTPRRVALADEAADDMEASAIATALAPNADEPLTGEDGQDAMTLTLGDACAGTDEDPEAQADLERPPAVQTIEVKEPAEELIDHAALEPGSADANEDDPDGAAVALVDTFEASNEDEDVPHEHGEPKAPSPLVLEECGSEDVDEDEDDLELVDEMSADDAFEDEDWESRFESDDSPRSRFDS